MIDWTDKQQVREISQYLRDEVVDKLTEDKDLRRLLWCTLASGMCPRLIEDGQMCVICISDLEKAVNKYVETKHNSSNDAGSKEQTLSP